MTPTPQTYLSLQMRCLTCGDYNHEYPCPKDFSRIENITADLLELGCVFCEAEIMVIGAAARCQDFTGRAFPYVSPQFNVPRRAWGGVEPKKKGGRPRKVDFSSFNAYPGDRRARPRPKKAKGASA